MILPDGRKEEAMLSPAMAMPSDSREQLFTLLDTVHEQYQNQLFSDDPHAQKALEYLKDQRGFSEDEIKKCGFGYSTGREIWTGMREEGWKEQDVISCGLASKRDGDRLKPAFFSRIMIPIHNEEGRLVAFGGRSIVDDPKIPKYINSSETPLFSKKNVLFGLDKARDSIIKEGNVLVVEGYMDALALRKAGIVNVVATMGTALTDQHVAQLERISPDVTYSFDNDKPGRKATELAIERAGARVGILTLEVPAKDADEYLRSHSKDDFVNLKSERISVPAQLLSKKTEKPARKELESVSILD